MNNEIDQDAVNLARAIRQKESGGNFNAIGDSGTSRGAYQWQPGTWKTHAKQVLGNDMAPMTKENQNAVAYGVIKSLKDSGKNVAQIAAIWNSGTDKNWETKKGYNEKLKVKYDVPAYVEGVIGNYQKIKTGGAPPVEVAADVTAPVEEYKQQLTPASQLPQPVRPSFVQDFRKNAVDTVTKMEDVENDPRLGGIERFTRKAGALAGGLLGVTGSAIERGVPALIRGAAGLVMPQAQAQQAPAQVAQAIPGALQRSLENRFPGAATAVKGLMGTQLGSQIKQGVPAALDAGTQAFNQFEKFAGDRENNPVANVLYESVAKPAVQVAGAVGEITGANSLLRGGVRALTRAPELVRGASNLFTPAERVIKTSIINDFSKGVKPLIRANATTGQAKKYQEAVVGAVDTINQNKLNLQFIDDAGQVISGRTPENLKEMAESIEQTKKVIFNQYDELASRVGETGAKINPKSVVKELETISNNKALSLSSPDTVSYAQQVMQRYANAGELTPSQTQEIIQNYNASLESFYRNPSYDTASRAMIDSMVANNLRNELDTTINSLTGDAYQALKNQYGQLKMIERDVSKANLRDARKNIKGLVDFTDVFSGGQVLNGILSMNPASIAQGLTQKAIAAYIKHLNNPNRYIKKLFENAEKLKGLTPVQ